MLSLQQVINPNDDNIKMLLDMSICELCKGIVVLPAKECIDCSHKFCERCLVNKYQRCCGEASLVKIGKFQVILMRRLKFRSSIDFGIKSEEEGMTYDSFVDQEEKRITHS